MKRWEDQNWQKEMKLTFDYNNMLKENIGEHGISLKDLESFKEKAKEIYSDYLKLKEKGNVGFMNLPYETNTKQYHDFVVKNKDKFDNLVVIGIGGSSLGAIAVQTALNHPFYNQLDKEKRNGFPKIYFAENVDPEGVKALLDVIDVEKTLFNVISKSGGTAETMANYMVFRDALKEKLGDKYNEHIVATTDAKSGILRKIVDEEKFEMFELPGNVGGRFSVLTPVGLLPLSMVGIDIDELLAGAKYMDQLCANDNLMANPAMLNAVLHYLADVKNDQRISVLFPYVNALKDVADWYRQLWAESLGKKFNTKGEVVNVGPTPVKSVGTIDQHSQVQLYAEGPFDKVVTFIGVKNYRNQVKIPVAYTEIGDLGYLAGREMQDLIIAEQIGTEVALRDAGRPTCTITLPEVNAFTLGQLLYMYELQTAFSGFLYNIDPYDQPGVEGGKKATFALMGRVGFEQLGKDIETKNKKDKTYII